MLVDLKQQKVECKDWQGEFERVLTERGKSDLTIKNYLVDLAAFAAWFQEANGQAFSPELLNSWDLRAYRTWCLEVKHYKPATWNRRHASMRMFMGCFQKTGQIVHNPMEFIATADAEDEAPHWLTKAEFGRLMRQLELDTIGANTMLRRWRAVRDAAAVSVMVYAGLRVGELVNLLTTDLQVSERQGVVVVRLGKGQKYRRVPLNVEARRSVSQWNKIRPVGSNYLFVDDDGQGLTVGAIQERVAAIGESAKVDGLTPHRLRHTCAKRMVDAGTPITVVRKILGHAKISTTQRYTLPGWEDLEEAVESVVIGKMARITLKTKGAK